LKFDIILMWRHPIVRLSEMTDPDSQFGVVESSPQMLTLRQLFGSGTVTGSVTLMEIGNDRFGRLFQEHPQLKLFVAPRGITGANAIESTGEGLRVRFVESR
jgi:hypothetical protein